MKRSQMSAEQALREIARQNNTTIEEVRKEIKRAMFIGLCSTDPDVRKKWKEIPCAGEIPTPEELIDYVVSVVTGTGSLTTSNL